MIDSSWYIRPPNIPERLAAGGVVVRRGKSGLFIALARERDYPDYILPKGGIERGESDLQAAQREIAEELGIRTLVLLDDLGVRERLSSNRRRWTRCHYFLFLTDQFDGTPTDRRHHYVGPTWFALDKLPRLYWPEQQELIESSRPTIAARVTDAPGSSSITS